jgi:hypothetical protein
MKREYDKKKLDLYDWDTVILAVEDLIAKLVVERSEDPEQIELLESAKKCKKILLLREESRIEKEKDREYKKPKRKAR